MRTNYKYTSSIRSLQHGTGNGLPWFLQRRVSGSCLGIHLLVGSMTPINILCTAVDNMHHAVMDLEPLRNDPANELPLSGCPELAS